VIASLLLLACARPTPIVGDVVDPWGTPVPDATIVLEGVVERWQADSQGRFHLETDAAPRTVIAGKAGYMRGSAPLPEGVPEGGTAAPVRVVLWPEAAQPGFFAVGPRGYVHLPAREVRLLGPARKGGEPVPGVTVPADALIPSGTSGFVFRSTVSPAQMKGLDLRLSRLRPLEIAPSRAPRGSASGKAPAPGTASEAPLYQSRDDLPYMLEAMPARDTWKVSLEVPLGPGVYAWHTANALGIREQEAWELLPRERRLAWTFHVE
jgi:hypothetical protein